MNTPQYKIGDKVWKLNKRINKAKEYTILGIIQAEDMHLRKKHIIESDEDRGFINIYYQISMIDNNDMENDKITRNMFVDEYGIFESKEELLASL